MKGQSNFIQWISITWRAIISAACFNALEAFCSPSAAMTKAQASRAASASAAFALCSWTGKRTSLLFKLNIRMQMTSSICVPFLNFRSKSLHFNALHFDAPWVGRFVKSRLHQVGDVFTLSQNFRQILGAQHVTQRRSSQQTGRVAVRIVLNWQKLKKKNDFL